MPTKLRSSIDELKVMQKDNSDAIMDVLINIETLMMELERKINDVNQRIDRHSRNLDAHKEQVED